jgi:hypothetical protein
MCILIPMNVFLFLINLERVCMRRGPTDLERIDTSYCNLIPSDVLMKISVFGIMFFLHIWVLSTAHNFFGQRDEALRFQVFVCESLLWIQN